MSLTSTLDRLFVLFTSLLIQTSFKEPLDSGTQLMYATVVLDLDKLNKVLQTNVKDLQQHCKTVRAFYFYGLTYSFVIAEF